MQSGPFVEAFWCDFAEPRLPKISLVGHSQLPCDFDVPAWETKVFRAPGGRAESFFEDPRLCNVLEWPHDICVLWLGSNDIREDTVVKTVVDDICKVVYEIEEKCSAQVIIILVEPRFYPFENPVSHFTYTRVQKGINRQLKRRLKNRNFIRYNSPFWANHLARDGVHFDDFGKRHIMGNLIEVVRRKVEGRVDKEESDFEEDKET